MILYLNILVALTAGIALVNVALLISLLTIYARIYKKTKGASLLLTLIFFAGMLILHNLIAVYTYFAMESLYSRFAAGNTFS